jgi:hypothetical protein
LGTLNYIRIWHDNTGQGNSASWFLKYIIIRDLQTMEKFYFICQKWLAVEKNDGRVSLPMILLILLFIKFRLNVFYLWQVNTKNKNFLIYSPNKLIIVFLKVIFGFPSSLDRLRLNSHVYNDVHVVLFYFLSQCFLIFSIMIKQHKQKQRRKQIVLVYHWALFISVRNRFVGSSFLLN